MSEKIQTTAAVAAPWRWVQTAKILAVRTVRDSVEDRLPGLAAEVSFFLLVSLPPLLLVGMGALGYVGEYFGADAVATIQDRIIDAAATVLTAETVRDVVEPAVASLLRQGRADVLSIGVILALWSGSRAIKVIVEAVTVAYDLEDPRTWWQRRLVGVALTMAGVVTLAILLPLLVVGPEAGAAFAERFGLATAVETVWSIAYYPVVIVLGLAVLAWVYHFVPPHSTPWRRDVPGAVLAFVVWLLGSFGLRFYATQFIEPNSAYGVLGTPIVVLLWLYVTSVSLLVGAELNAEIERLSRERLERDL